VGYFQFDEDCFGVSPLNPSALGLKAFLPTHAKSSPSEEDARGLPTLRRFSQSKPLDGIAAVFFCARHYPSFKNFDRATSLLVLSNSHHETVEHERNSSSRRCRARGQVEEVSMQDAKTYHQYAADCRRMASTMNVNDGKILLKMADAWDERAKEAERLEKTRAEN
jgi:hypothetical protein